MHGTTRPEKSAAKTPLDTLVAEIKSEHAEFLSTSRRTLEQAIVLGKKLKKLKKQVGHGKWLSWLPEHIPEISDRSAQDFMRLARHEEKLFAKSAVAADLTIAAAVALTRKPKKPRDPAKKETTEPADVTDDDNAAADDAEEDTDTDALVASLLDKIEEALDPLREDIEKVIEEGVPDDRAAVVYALREHAAVVTGWITKLTTTTEEKVASPTKH
jgi:hypothetical protein